MRAQIVEFADTLLQTAQQASAGIVLAGPADPDGDSIGASMALAWALRKVCGAPVWVVGQPGFRYAWLPGANSMVPDAEVSLGADLCVVLDGDRHRLHPTVGACFASAQHTAIVDHHRSTTAAGYSFALIDPAAPSTCTLVLAIIDHWGLQLDATVAAALYTGLVFDTGGFRHANTSAGTHGMAARLLSTGIDATDIAQRVLYERREAGNRLLGRVMQRAVFADAVAYSWITLDDFAAEAGDYADLEGAVDHLLMTRGVELACLFIERTNQRVKLSLRSRRYVDVSVLARVLGPDGGGHRRAAGVDLLRPMATVLADVPLVLREHLQQTLSDDANTAAR